MLIVLTLQCGIGETREPLGDKEGGSFIRILYIVTGTVFGTPI